MKSSKWLLTKLGVGGMPLDPYVMARKESIVVTAIDVMNEFGVQSLSTREIAKREGITEGAIFKHYPKKTDLVLAVLDYFSKFDKDIIDSIEKRSLEPKEAISYFIDAYATYYQGYPAISAIAQAYDEMRYNPIVEARVKEIVGTRLHALTQLVEKAKQSGVLKAELDTMMVTDVIDGTFSGICLRWRLQGFGFSFKDQCNQTIEMILEAFE